MWLLLFHFCPCQESGTIFLTFLPSNIIFIVSFNVWMYEQGDPAVPGRWSESRNPVAGLSENLCIGSWRSSPMNFYKPPWTLFYFSRANHRRRWGQRAPLDVLQLPTGKVRPSHRPRITNSLLSVLTSDCSQLTPPHFTYRELCTTWERALHLRNVSHLQPEGILTGLSYVFHSKYQVIKSEPKSSIINRKSLTLFTFCLTEHPLKFYITVYGWESFFWFNMNILHSCRNLFNFVHRFWVSHLRQQPLLQFIITLTIFLKCWHVR